LIVGGIIPAEDAERLKAMGVARVYTPKDYDISRIMGEVVEIVSAAASRAA
jgi:(2R)-ethylmalonyl-CoA mutase